MTANYSFCPDHLWDLNVTWYTTHPDFTSCFHLTILIYVPFAILILLAPIQVYYCFQSKYRGIAISRLSGIRILLTSILIILACVETGISGTSYVQDLVLTAYIVAPAVKLISYTIALILHLACIRFGLVTSGILFAFWLSKVVCLIFTFCSVIIYDIHSDDGLATYAIICLVEFPLVLFVFILQCWADKKPLYSILDEDEKKLIPEEHSSFSSKICFFWLDPLIWMGWKKVLAAEDMWVLTLDNRCKTIVPHWDREWEKQERASKDGKGKASIVPAMIRTFGPAYSFSVILTAIYSVLQFANPQIVNLLIDFVQSDEPEWRGYFYAVLICAVNLFITIINTQSFFILYRVGLRLKTALISAIYRKALKLSSTGRTEMTVGETTNLMSIDTQKFMDLLLWINVAWASPFQIALAMYFLWQILGPSSLAGLAVMVIIIPLNGVVVEKMKKYQFSQMQDKDNRTKMMDEILNGIKVIKLYAWEEPFRNTVLDIRFSEYKALVKNSYFTAVTTFLWTSAPFLVALASFATYVMSDENNILDANTAFVSLTLFNLLRLPLNMLPMLLVFIVQCAVSVRRVNKFMSADELDSSIVQKDKLSAKETVLLEKASFTWEESLNDTLINLKDINLKVKEGSLVAVVGIVGSGKSSLLSSMLGEMKLVSGSVSVRGKIAYAPQQAWMQNATLRSNILFGKKHNSELYERVLEACALKTDLEVLPGGDATEIGEKGINLSGGQKQRISVARSVYSNGDVYLLDDPLSAVDSHVGKHIFDNVIGPNGLLKNKTRILVTHGISYLPQVDNIIVMKDGRISEQGSYQELLRNGNDFADFLIQYIADENDANELDPSEELEDIKHTLETVLGKEKLARRISASSAKSGLSDLMSETDGIHGAQNQLSNIRQKHSNLLRGVSALSDIGEDSVDEERHYKTGGTQLIKEEEMVTGKVKWSVYLCYLRAIGWQMASATTVFYLLYQAFSLCSNIWLSKWSTDPLASTDDKVRNYYLSVYGTFGLGQALFIMVATSSVMIGTLKASSSLHEKMLTNILHSTMQFFDTTPVGRVLNRFSKDMDIMDVTIPMNIRQLFVQFFYVVGTVFILCYTNPIFIFVFIPMGIMYYCIQKFYVTTARQVKRLDAITRSPIYSHFSETIGGASTIRAFGATTDFILENERRIDLNQQCYYPVFVSSRWLSIRLETIGNIIILFASLFAVISRGNMDPGQVGLSLSYALTITVSLNLLVRVTSEIETNMVSIERVQEYQNTDQEAPSVMPGQDPPIDWPENGVIKFDNYQTRYREGLDLVLRGISFETLSGEKIGIVGRTGAGKSSLSLALFRVLEAVSGSIYIDDENIALIGLERLRSKLTIIPQDPFLFSGTLRTNLDPFSQYSDRQLWQALEVAHLSSYVSSLPSALDHLIVEGGQNLSVGQRQLICLARAILRKTKILILDEATAAVDLETDDLIQDTIRAEFSQCTVMTIAHRLNTIMDSNRVIVLEDGRIKEMDSPANLLADKKSQFYGMAKDAGLVNGDQ